MLNPPSGITAANYWAAIKAGKPTHVRITFLGQDIVLTDEDIDVSTGITVNDVLNSDTDLVFGKAVCKQVSMQILNSDALTGLIWTGEFTLEFGVEMGSPAVTEWVTVGTFSGDKPKNVTTAQTIAFDAYDRMKRFDILADDYVKGISYPATLATIYSGLCAFVGVSKEAGSELPNIMSRSFSSAPAEMAGYTCRDLLAWIAEACGCYAKINAAGKVQMVWFTDNTGHTVSADEEFSVETGDIHAGLTWDEADTFTWDEIETMTWNDVCGYEEAYSIDQIMLKQLDNDLDINYPYPYGGNVYMIVDNPFLAVGSGSDITNYVKPIYDRLAEFGGYLPVSMNCIGNWCVEAGDLITISVQDNSISFPIFVKTMHWNGAVVDEYETTGQKDRAVYTSEKNKQKVLTNKEIKLFVDGKYYGVVSGIDITEEGILISGAKWLKLESGGVLDVSSTNFRLSSEDKLLVTGNWQLGTNGAIYNFGTYNDEQLIFQIAGLQTSVLSSATTAIVTERILYNFHGQTHFAFAIDMLSSDYNNSTGARKRSGLTFTYNNNESQWELRKTTNALLSDSSTDVHALGSSQVQWDKAFVKEINGGIENAIKIKRGSDTPSILQWISYRREPMPGTSTLVDCFGVDCIEGNLSVAMLGCQGKEWSHIYGKTIFYTTLVQNSSRDIKHDIKDLPSVGEKLDQLRPVTFVYDKDADEKQRMGLIYEEAVKVMPEICTNNEANKAINYVELIPALLKEIQELRARVAELERRG